CSGRRPSGLEKAAIIHARAALSQHATDARYSGTHSTVSAARNGFSPPPPATKSTELISVAGSGFSHELLKSRKTSTLALAAGLKPIQATADFSALTGSVIRPASIVQVLTSRPYRSRNSCCWPSTR